MDYYFTLPILQYDLTCPPRGCESQSCIAIISDHTAFLLRRMLFIAFVFFLPIVNLFYEERKRKDYEYTQITEFG